MPKVLRIINRFNIGGPTFNAAYLTKYMAPDYETLLVGGAIDESEGASNYILDKLHITPAIVSEMQREIDYKRDVAAYKRIKEIIADFRPDIIHTHASKAGTLGRLAGAFNSKAKIVHTFHGHVFHSYFGKMKTLTYKNIERYLAYKSDKIIAISERQKQELTEIHKICPSKKVEVIPLGFDLGRFQIDYQEKRANFRSVYQIKDEEIAIGIIGRLVPVKNHDLFLMSIKNLLEKTTKKVRVFVIGDGEEREALQQKCVDLELENSYYPENKQEATVVFTSWIKDIDWANAGLDIIALTSLNEGTPVSLIEAQASNTPIVTTDVGGIRNIVKENETALICPSEDLEGFSRNMLAIVEDDQMRLQMQQNGWDHVKTHFHYNRLVDDMKGLYDRLLS